jgi:hypothetical protein
MMDDGYERRRHEKRCKLEAENSLKEHGRVRDKKEFSFNACNNN